MYVLDRFEEDLAVIEVTDKNGDITYIKAQKAMLSPEAKEGDVLSLNGNIYVTDKKATELRRKSISVRLKTRKKDPVKIWNIYQIISIAVLLPGYLLTAGDIYGFFGLCPEWYMSLVIIYGLSGVPYINFTFNLGFLIFSIYEFSVNKKKKLFIKECILTLIFVVVNIFILNISYFSVRIT